MKSPITVANGLNPKTPDYHVHQHRADRHYQVSTNRHPGSNKPNEYYKKTCWNCGDDVPSHDRNRHQRGNMVFCSVACHAEYLYKYRMFI